MSSKNGSEKTMKELNPILSGKTDTCFIVRQTKYRVFLLLLLFIPFIPGASFADEITDVMPRLIMAESSGNQYARSSKGCSGLCQMSKIAWGEVMTEPYSEVFNPTLNKKAGERYLRLLKKRLGSNYTPERCLAAYNMGLSRLKKLDYQWWKIDETRKYVKKIMKGGV